MKNVIMKQVKVRNNGTRMKNVIMKQVKVRNEKRNIETS